MPTIRFTQNLQRHVECPERHLAATTIREALDRYFDDVPRARGYVLDETGALRQHMAIFVNGILIGDRSTLTDPVEDRDTIDVMQALSGG